MQTFYNYLISEVVCNIYQVCVTMSRKGASPDLLQLLHGSREVFFHSARQQNYPLCLTIVSLT